MMRGRKRAQTAGQRRTSLLRRRRRTPGTATLRVSEEREMIGGCMGFIDFIVRFVNLGMGNKGVNEVKVTYICNNFPFKKYALLVKVI